MDFKEFKNESGGVTGLCVIVDCLAGLDDAVLDGIVANFRKGRPATILPVSVGYIKTKGDYLVPMLVKDIAAVDDIIIDRIRSVEGVTDIKSYIFNLHVPDSDEPFDPAFPERPLMAHGIVFIDVESGKDREVLKAVSDASDEEVAINFFGHCFHSNDCDMIAFVSAVSHARLFEWVREKIRSIDGVLDTDTDVITGQEPLITAEEAQSLLEALAKIE